MAKPKKTKEIKMVVGFMLILTLIALHKIMTCSNCVSLFLPGFRLELSRKKADLGMYQNNNNKHMTYGGSTHNQNFGAKTDYRNKSCNSWLSGDQARADIVTCLVNMHLDLAPNYLHKITKGCLSLFNYFIDMRPI